MRGVPVETFSNQSNIFQELVVSVANFWSNKQTNIQKKKYIMALLHGPVKNKAKYKITQQCIECAQEYTFNLTYNSILNGFIPRCLKKTENLQLSTQKVLRSAKSPD